MSLTVEQHFAQATAFHEQNLPEKALLHLEQILLIEPHHLPTLRMRGFSLMSLQKWAQALACYQHLLSLNNQDIDALIKCGRIHLFLKQPQQALPYLNTAVTIAPNNVLVIALRGNAFTALKRPKAAALCFAHALSINPNDIGLLINHGCVLYELTEYAQALACFEKVLSINPNHFLGLSYRAFCLVSFNRHIEAMTDYEKAVRINPNHAITQFNESLCRLVMGDYKVGWQKHEWRWKSEMIHVNRTFTQPLWLGDADLTNKTILLYAEQGFGDTLHFIRYVPMVKALGAHIIVEAQRELIPFINTVGGIDQLFAQGDDLPETDYRCPLMSLPLAFSTELNNIPATIPYLCSDADLVKEWQRKLAHLTKPYKVGITWSGNLANKTNKRRAITLDELLTIKPENVDFISLQKRILPEELSLLNERGIAHFTDELTDFNQTAALIECLDLVITVDTSVAHVAGTMGKPLWILLAFSADWRWLLNRNDSPWYPNATLFRQHAMWDWGKVVEEVKEKLKEFGGGL